MKKTYKKVVRGNDTKMNLSVWKLLRKHLKSKVSSIFFIINLALFVDYPNRFLKIGTQSLGIGVYMFHKHLWRCWDTLSFENQ